GLGVVLRLGLDDDLFLLDRLRRERGVERQQLAVFDDDALDALGRVRYRAYPQRVLSGGGLEQIRAVRVREPADRVHRRVGRKQGNVGERDGIVVVGADDFSLDLPLRSRKRGRGGGDQECEGKHGRPREVARANGVAVILRRHPVGLPRTRVRLEQEWT